VHAICCRSAAPLGNNSDFLLRSFALSAKLTTECRSSGPTAGYGVSGVIMMRRSCLAAVTALACAALALAPSVAIAGNPTDSGYATNEATGIAGEPCVTVLDNSDPSGSHVNETLWLYDSTALPWWTEVGIWNGENLSGHTTTVPTFYWEDNNSVYGDTWHGDFGVPVVSGSHYYAYIRYRSGNWWDVYINGWTTGSGSYHEYSYGTYEQVGDEWTNALANYESGAVQGIGYWDTSDTWQSGWPFANNEQTSPGQGFWYKQYYYYSTILRESTWSC
jgi:hypothetical protein